MTQEELIEGTTKKAQIDAVAAAIIPLDNEALIDPMDIITNIQNEHQKILAVVDATTQSALNTLITDLLADYLSVLNSRKLALETEFALIGEGDA